MKNLTFLLWLLIKYNKDVKNYNSFIELLIVLYIVLYILIFFYFVFYAVGILLTPKLSSDHLGLKGKKGD